ncbi:DUF421 domain-containing protein [Rhodobacteraceae bacterium CCMM004]|nr:DUF421 domain-containing protein [Rhodobacteraceae bacterium CCMM004]
MDVLADLANVAARTAVAVAVVIALTRIVGLRSFSKMSAFDFAATVAVGSILAAIVTDPDGDLAVTLGALAALFAVQAVVGWARRASGRVEAAVDNRPLILMRDGEILEDNLTAGGVTLGDLKGKLREANALDRSRVRAVVLETTGDISVLHGDGPDVGWLLEGLRR